MADTTANLISHSFTILSPVFYSFFLGMAWPPKDSMNAPSYLLELFAKSLFLSWVVVFVSYWMGLGDLFLVLLAIVVFSVSVRFRSSKVNVVFDTGIIGQLSMVAVVMTGFYMVVLLLGGYAGFFFPIFGTNDALASWNRWAIELSRNEYNPYNAAYPVIYPGLWSLIYKVQGHSDVWLVAKATTLFLPLIVTVGIAAVAASGAYLAALFLAVHAYYFFFVGILHPTFVGDMDAPLSIMLFTTLVICLAAVRENSPRILRVAAVFAGITVIVKQAGIVALFLLAATVYGLLRRGSIDRAAATWLMALSAIPLVLFALIFVASGQPPLGNLEGLQNLSASAANGGSRLIAAAQLLVGLLPGPLFYLVVGLAVSNVLYLTKLEGVLGALAAIIAGAGFLQFAHCCSYDPRNGWWVIALLIGSAACSLAVTQTYLPNYVGHPRGIRSSIVAVGCLMGGAAGSLVLAALLPPERLMQRQLSHQWELMPQDAVDLLTSQFDALGSSGRIISEYHFAQWLPGFRDRYVICGVYDAPCITGALKQYPGSMILTESPQNDALARKTVPDLVSDETVAGAANVFTLYHPFEQTRRNPGN